MWGSHLSAGHAVLDPGAANSTVVALAGLHGAVGKRVPPHLFPLGEFDSVLLASVFLASALGSAVGIGGGGILVPLLVSVGEFTVREAVPLTQVAVLGAAAVNVAFKIPRRHPFLDRPLIDYNVALLLEIYTLVGTVVGVDLNRVSPTWAITLILIVVLGSVAVRTLRHAAEMRREELASHFEREQREAQGGSGGDVSLDTEQDGGFGGTDGSLGAASPGLGGAHMHGGSGEAGDEKEEEAGGDAGEEEGGRVRRGLVEALDEAAEADCSDGEDAPLLARTADASERGRRCVVKGKGRGNAAQDWVRWGSEGSVGVLDGSRRVAADWATEMRGEERGTPGRQVLRMLACSLLVSALAVAKGGENGSGLVVCGSPGYWALKVAAMLLLLLAGRLTSLDLLRRHAAKEQVGYEFHPSEVQWTDSTALRWPVLCIGAGVAAGMLGIGGGILKGPIMIEMGVPPPVVAATAAYMLLFTTASTTAQFAALRVVLWDYAASLGSPARPFRVTPRMRAPARKPERANKTPARRLLTREGWGFAEDRVTAALAAVASQLVMKKFIESHHFQWPITALIGLVILLSTVLMVPCPAPRERTAVSQRADEPGAAQGLAGILATLVEIDEGEWVGPHSLCGDAAPP